MATSYLLACSCGRDVVVEPGQAGDRVRCECGNDLVVPKLGQLRTLPQVDTAEKPSAWTARHGLMTLAAIVAAVGLGVGLYFWIITPAPEDYDPAPEIAEVESFHKGLNPLQTWHYWISETVPLAQRGLQKEDTLETLAFQQKVQQGRKYQLLAFGTAGAAMLLGLAAALWR